MRLNLGCGSQTPKDWINVDYALGARFSKLPFFQVLNRKFKIFNLDWSSDIYLYDLTRSFPWEDASVDIIYSSHALEHLSKADGYHFLKECQRVLRPSGILRVVVPDLSSIVKKYLEEELRADDFVEALGVLYNKSRNPLKNWLAPFVQSPHQCMYDTKTLLKILHEIGFKAEGKQPFESDISDIENIELAARTQEAVIVEGKKL